MLMEFVQTSLFREMEKTLQLENEKRQQNSNYTFSHVGEGSSIKPNEPSKSLQFGIVFTLTPIQKTKKKLKLESDALIAQRVQENYFKNMNIGNNLKTSKK